MLKLDLDKLKTLMDSGVVSSVYFTTGGKDNSISTKYSTDQVEDIKIDIINTLSIQQGYNYSKLKPTDFVCVICNSKSKNHYSISVSAEHLLELLDMLNWDFSFSHQDTAKLFNQLLMSANQIGRRGGYSQDLVSRVYALTMHQNFTSKEKVYFTVSGTAIEDKEKFGTIEDVYSAVNNNYVKNVISSNSLQEHQI